MDTKLQLEIYADDVKCSYGATVGRIDAAQLFYMQSRGIDKHATHQMIIFAFAAELTANIANETLREWRALPSSCRGRMHELSD